MPSSSASASSSAVLPTPEKMISLRRDAGRPRPPQFAVGDHVHAGAEPRQRREHRLVGVRLHGVADERRLAGEGVGEHAEMPRQRRGRIAVERRADLGREHGQVDALGVQDAVAIFEMVHGRSEAATSKASRGKRSCGPRSGLCPEAARRQAAGRRRPAARRWPREAARARLCARNRQVQAPARTRTRSQRI